MSWSTSELRVRLAPLNRFKPSSKIFYWPFQGGTSFVDLSCFCSVLCLLCLCASVYMCFVVTCWERADLLALVCGVFCEFVTFPLVSWVRCGTWLYRFLIFAPLLTFFRWKYWGIVENVNNCMFETILQRLLAWTLKFSPWQLDTLNCVVVTFFLHSCMRSEESRAQRHVNKNGRESRLVAILGPMTIWKAKRNLNSQSDPSN